MPKDWTGGKTREKCCQAPQRLSPPTLIPKGSYCVGASQTETDSAHTSSLAQQEDGAQPWNSHISECGRALQPEMAAVRSLLTRFQYMLNECVSGRNRKE